jgi:hypothetical protein
VAQSWPDVFCIKSLQIAILREACLPVARTKQVKTTDQQSRDRVSNGPSLAGVRAEPGFVSGTLLYALVTALLLAWMFGQKESRLRST